MEINFCAFYGKNPPRLKQNANSRHISGGGAHTRFRLREVSDPALELTGAIEIHFVNMVKWRQLAGKDLRGNPLHRWLAWLDPESPPELVEEVKNMDGAIAFAEDRQGFVMQDDESRELYWSRQIAEMDRRAEIAFALDKAEMDRKAEIAFALEKAARNALAKGLSIELIHEITGLDMETIAELQPR